MIRTQNTLLTGGTMLADACLGASVYASMVLAKGLWHAPGAKASVAVIGLIYLYTVFNSGVLHYKKGARRWQIPVLVLKNVVLLAIFGSLVLYVSHVMVLSPLRLALTYCLIFLASSVFRLTIYSITKKYYKQESHTTKVILLGSESSNLDLYEEMRGMRALGYRVSGYFDYAPNEEFPEECPYMGKPAEVTDYLKEHPEVKGIYCSLPSQKKDDILPVIDYCLNHLVGFFVVPSVRNYLYNRVFFNMMGNVPVLSLYESPLSDPRRKVVKRLFDIVFSLTFLCTLFPLVLLIVSIITKLTMPGPVFFRQKRNGIGGRTFYCYKFRSMKVNADADKVQATRNDPRKTKWGNIMRKTNIDELPQFINVLLGDMSVVGPRPHMQKHTDEYSKLIDKYMMRHLVKPGITGWSQVTGFRGETRELWQMEGRVKCDIWYIEHWSFGLDLFIIYKTIKNILQGEDAAY